MSRLFRDVDGGRVVAHRSVVCIGAFDGLHRGHQALVRHTLARARERGHGCCVLSFEPLPREFFLGAAAPARIASGRDRFERLRDMGVDLIGMLRFNAALAAMSAQDFVRRVLVQRLAASEVWVGEDFRFGHRRQGDPALLQVLGSEHDFEAHCIDTHLDQGIRVSSSAVRAALASGCLDDAERLLGRRYSIGNRVVRGRQLGRTLGFPTANMRVAGRHPALNGIFAVRVHGVQPGRAWPGVASLGTRPTVGGVEPLLEAHLFDFDGDLYGRRLQVEFVAKLRDEEKFEDLPTLIAQMHEDARAARGLLDVAETDQRKLA